VVEISEPAADASTPVLLWVTSTTELPDLGTWARLPLLAEDGSPRAEARALLTDTHFHLDLVVTDPDHVGSSGGANLWQGDSLQIAFDLHGDAGGQSGPETRGPLGPDDIAFGIALSSDTASSWIFFRDASLGRSGPLPADSFSVTRDSAAGTTHYRLAFPLSLVGVQPGLNPEIGLALLLNDFSKGVSTPARAYFGRGADGVPRPGLHARLRLSKPPVPIAAAHTTRSTAWDSSAPAVFQFAAGGPVPLRATLSVGDASPTTIDIPGDVGIRRYRLVADSLPAAFTPAHLTIAPASTPDKPIFSQATSLISPAAQLAAFEARIETLLAAPDVHPLFSHHLRSMRALVLSEWARLQLYRPRDPRLTETTVSRISDWTKALHAEVGDWSAYLDGRRSLLMSFVSPHDGTLQFYQFNLPKNWDPEKAYPLFFELHGAGDSNPLGFAFHRLAVTEAAPDLHGYTAPKTYAEIQRNGYWVHPFGRGNLGYRGIAEIDIFEAYDDVHARFKIDPDRRYLYGFSMGGGGTWANALRTPDRWAAIAILAGAPRGDLNDSLVLNIRHLPVWIWCGELDGLFPRTQAMVAALRRHDIEPVYSTTPDLGHNYVSEKQVESLNWLQTHVRRRPDSFQFTTDSDTRTSAWGISLERDLTLSGLPSFKVRIDGSTVHLDSDGTRRLTLDPGPDGLRLAGDEFILIWNGSEVYRGPLRPLTLADGKATPSEPRQANRR
jgi:predicted esterase